MKKTNAHAISVSNKSMINLCSNGFIADRSKYILRRIGLIDATCWALFELTGSAAWLPCLLRRLPTFDESMAIRDTPCFLLHDLLYFTYDNYQTPCHWQTWHLHDGSSNSYRGTFSKTQSNPSFHGMDQNKCTMQDLSRDTTQARRKNISYALTEFNK